LYGQSLKPDLVIFLNGMNDLTNGATSATLFGEPVKTMDGSQWTRLYHTHDYGQRVTDYLQNIREAISLTGVLRSDFLVVLQPTLVERIHITSIENALLEGSLKPHASASALTESYELIRKGLSEHARQSHIYFLDSSRVFNEEQATTFSDMWHFSDFGHEIIGKAMAPKIADVLRQRLNARYRANSWPTNRPFNYSGPKLDSSGDWFIGNATTITSFDP